MIDYKELLKQKAHDNNYKIKEGRLDLLAAKFKHQKEQYGEMYCPCQLLRNEDTICPCLYMRKYNTCRCGLYEKGQA